MKLSKKNMLVALAICVVLLLIGAYRWGRIQGEVEPTARIHTVYATSTPLPTLMRVTPTLTPTLTPTPLSDAEKAWEKLKTEASKKNIVCEDAIANKLYKQKNIVKAGDIVITIESYRITSDTVSLHQNKYYAVFDCSLVNLSATKHLIEPGNLFVLEEREEGFSYRPTLLSTVKGDLSGFINTNDFRRGEIAFEVPNNSSKFILRYYPESSEKSTIGNISFDMDLTSYKEERDLQRTYYWNNTDSRWENAIDAAKHPKDIDYGVHMQQPY